MSLKEKVNEIRLQLDATERELASLDGGRKASAARARKSLQLIKSLSHTLRKQIVDYTKALPTKRRTPIEVAEVPIVEEVIAVPKKARKAVKAIEQ
jgi:chromosome segregation ATPase